VNQRSENPHANVGRGKTVEDRCSDADMGHLVRGYFNRN
jgi:hypothetical protein